MGQPDRGAEPNFTQPRRQIFLILLALVLVGGGVWMAAPNVLPVFLANLYLNGFILFVFIVGLFATIWQVVQVSASVSWIHGYAADRPGHDPSRPPRLLVPLAGLLRGRGENMQIGTASARSILDSVATRIDEERDITRYVTNLLIFLGLLGTFYGLATTVPAVVDTIRSLAPDEGEGGVEVFNRLMTGLENQLGGMGTAFSSSLLGLAGSLVVGLLELFATHGQNRFYRQLEEWLSSITQLGFAPGEGEAGGDLSAAWLAHLAERMEAMQAYMARAESARLDEGERFASLARAIERLADIRAGQETVTAQEFARLAEAQTRLASALEERIGEEGSGPDAESRMRLRSIDVQLLRILEEMSAGRQESLSELRNDIATLTRAIRQLGGGQG